MAEQFIGVEATGVYIGKLVEDMIDTVKREKKLYCNVYIPEFFAKDSNYPLTYVPLWAMSLPLRKDDKVLVEFHQGNLMYPVLYKNPDELKDFDQFYKQFNTNKSIPGGNIQGYQPKDTVGAYRIGENSYVIKTDDYTLIHQKNGFILIDNNDKIYAYGNEINLISDGDLKTDVSGNTKMFSPTGKFKIGNNILSLGKALADMASAIDTILTGLGQIQTMVTGTAGGEIPVTGSGTTAAWYAAWAAGAALQDIANIKSLLTTLPNSFEK